jgi:hypothetical protein
MRGAYAKVLTAGLIVLAASPVFAQPRPGGPPGGGFRMDAAMLVNLPKVGEELKLTDDQKAEVQKAVDKAREKSRDEMEAAVLGALKPDQAKRLKQVLLQSAGLNAFSREDVQSALKLTDAQKKDIKETSDELQKDVQELFKDTQGDREKIGAAGRKAREMSTSTAEKIVKGLTDDQKKAWKDLTGDKIDLGSGGFGPPGGGGGPPGGGFGPPGGGFGGGPNIGGLLRNEKVGEELKLTDDQKAAVQKAADKAREKGRDDMEATVVGALKGDQAKRFKQVVVQAAGLDAFSREDVKSALKLTDAQQKDIKTTAEDVQKQIQDKFQDAAGDFSKFGAIMREAQELRTSTLDKVVKGLTDDQKKMWKDLTGDKIDLSSGPPRP